MTSKDQKMLGLIGILVLGAGGIWYMTSGSGDAGPAVSDSGRQERRTREPRAERTDERKERTRSRRVTEAPERRSREAHDDRSSQRRRRSRSVGTEKKKKITPAA